MPDFDSLTPKGENPDKLSISPDVNFRCPHCSAAIRYHKGPDYDDDYLCPICGMPMHLKIVNYEVKTLRIRVLPP